MDSRQRQYLDAMGIQRWQWRGDPDERSPETSPDGDVSLPGVVDGLDWDELATTVAACRRCELCESRTQTVFGVGNQSADCMVIGEAPGAEEDRQGEPFVGRAGQLLDAMLQAVRLDRRMVYIANILKCRPPNNRDPMPEEVVACRDYLQRQISLVQPRVILAVGRIAAQNLLQSNQPIGRLRGQEHTFGEGRIPVIVTYHPAYLLRSPLEKRKTWTDLLRVRQRLEERV